MRLHRRSLRLYEGDQNTDLSHADLQAIQSQLLPKLSNSKFKDAVNSEGRSLTVHVDKPGPLARFVARPVAQPPQPSYQGVSKMDKCWIVWSPLSTARNPMHQHKTEQLAADEAERLAKQHPGQQFAVMELKGVALVPVTQSTYTPVR